MHIHRHFFSWFALSSTVTSLARFLARLLASKKQTNVTSGPSLHTHQPAPLHPWLQTCSSTVLSTLRNPPRSPSLLVFPGCHNDPLPPFPTTAAAGKLFDVLRCSHCGDGEAVCQTGRPSGKLYSIQTHTHLGKPLPLESVTPSGRLVQHKREGVEKLSNTHFRETGKLLRAVISDAGVTFSVVGLDWSHMRIYLEREAARSCSCTDP